MDLCSASSGVDNILDLCGSEGAEPEGSLPPFQLTPVSCALGSDQKNNVVDTSGLNVFPSVGCLSQCEELRHPEGTPSSPLLLHVSI